MAISAPSIGLYVLDYALFGSSWSGEEIDPAQLLFLLPVMIVGFVCWVLASLLAIRRADLVLSGTQESLDSSLKQLPRRVLPYAGVSILFAIALTLGAMFCLIPALFVAFFWGFSYVIVATEDSGVFAAFDRSRETVRRMVGRWVVAVALIGILYFVVVSGAVAVQFAVDLVMPRIVASLAWAVGGVLTSLAGFVGIAAWTAVYRDFRDIKERGAGAL
jgi:Na+/H+-dicarboxylate symporter